MMELEIDAKGVNGQIKLFSKNRPPDTTKNERTRTVDREGFHTKVSIRRKGLISLISPGLKGDKDLMISEIESVHFKTADPSGNGYIQFFLKGDKKKEERMLRWVQDDNTVIFNASQQPLFEQIRDEVEKRMVSASANG